MTHTQKSRQERTGESHEVGKEGSIQRRGESRGGDRKRLEQYHTGAAATRPQSAREGADLVLFRGIATGKRGGGKMKGTTLQKTLSRK